MSHFEFIVSNEQDLRPSQIKQLYYINKRIQDYLQEQEAAKKRKVVIRRSVIADQK